jgi:hypothetical protein
MLTVLLAFIAGVIVAFATMRSSLRRFVLREAAEQRWQAFVDAACYAGRGTGSARGTPRHSHALRGAGTRRRVATATPRAAQRLTPDDPMRLTIRVMP